MSREKGRQGVPAKSDKGEEWWGGSQRRAVLKDWGLVSKPPVSQLGQVGQLGPREATCTHPAHWRGQGRMVERVKTQSWSPVHGPRAPSRPKHSALGGGSCVPAPCG